MSHQGTALLQAALSATPGPFHSLPQGSNARKAASPPSAGTCEKQPYSPGGRSGTGRGGGRGAGKTLQSKECSSCKDIFPGVKATVSFHAHARGFARGLAPVPQGRPMLFPSPPLLTRGGGRVTEPDPQLSERAPAVRGTLLFGMGCGGTRGKAVSLPAFATYLPWPSDSSP